MSLEALKVQKKDIEALIEWAKLKYPLESCAILVGNTLGKKAIAKEIFLVENAEQSFVRFSIDPIKLYEVYLEAEKKEREIVGIFHSHPAPSYPSSIDLEYMKVNQVAWVISGSNHTSKGILIEKPRAYYFAGQKLLEIQLEIT